MAKTPPNKKQRTRQHVIAYQSTIHVESYIADAGHTAHRVFHDYGYDLIVATFDKKGCIENGQIYIQLKASDSLPDTPTSGMHSFKVDIKDYNLWRYEPAPVFVILFDAKKRQAFYEYFQAYFEADKKREPAKKAKSVTIRIPVKNRINSRAIAYMREAKQRMLDQIDGTIVHHA